MDIFTTGLWVIILSAWVVIRISMLANESKFLGNFI